MFHAAVSGAAAVILSYHTGLSIYVTIFKIHPGQKSHSEDRKAAGLEEIWKF
jgi:hypothetical protein